MKGLEPLQFKEKMKKSWQLLVDIVAAEAHYHPSCYRDYTRENQERNIEETADPESDYKEVETEAFLELLQYIRTEMIPKKEVIPISTLRERLENLIKAKGAKELKESTTKHLHRRLESELGDSVLIISDNRRRLLAVPASLSINEVVIENQTLQRELDIWKAKATNTKKIIDKVSSCIRTDIASNKKPSPWPFHPTDVEGVFNVPEHLERFLLGLLTGDPDERSPSQRVASLIKSFSQDIVYAVTRGEQKNKNIGCYHMQ